MTDDTSQESILDRLIECVCSGMEWSVEQLKSACPSKLRKKQKCIKPKPETKDETDTGSSCTEKQPYKPRDQICPSCYIKMQDPYAPCCCETQQQLPPCPPKREPREPTCGCDLCKKKGIRSNCCDPTAYAFSRYDQQI